MHTARSASREIGLPRSAVAFAAFDLQLFAINGSGGNGFPADIIAVIEQKNFLETKLHKSLTPTRVFRTEAGLDWFDARIGETKTFTRSALIAPNAVPLNPANNTGFDNGMTADQRSFEQWTAELFEWPGFIPTNILGQEAFLADLYIDNMEKLAQKAGDSLELICTQRVFNAYDAADTFITQALTGGSNTTLHLDNVGTKPWGFTTQYPASNAPSYQTPQPISNSNPGSVVVLDGTTGLIKYIGTFTGFTTDGSNSSIMQFGGQAFGYSGTLTGLSPACGAVAIGDRVVAVDPGYASSTPTPTIGGAFNPIWKDGSYLLRPLSGGTTGTMIGTAYAMAAGNVMIPSVMIPYAVAILKRRKVPPLRNGLYGCAIDSTLLAAFYGDDGFQRATMGTWERGSVFANGIIAKGWGVEFVEDTQLPVYAAPVGGFSLRHASVFGKEMITEHPFVGARNAANIVAGVGDIADERWVDRIKFRSLAALDTLGQVIKVAYDYVGDFEPGTDKSSNPTIVFTSDWQRFKRNVVIQTAAPF